MGTQPLGTFIRRLRQVVGAKEGGGLTDAQLLDRFVAGRDEAAFEVLLWRHGPMVLGVCRRLLRHEQDAEDAFQATFLALARKAEGITSQASLGAWLHRVASRVALRARRRTAERAARERAGVDTLPAPPEPAALADLRVVLDEEVNRLPDRYRVPFVLCYLESRTQQEAARQLGCPPGTVASRLAWARDRLRARLTRRGLGLSTGALATLLRAEGAPAAMPAALVDATIKAALAFAAGGTAAAGLATAPAALAEGVLHAMRLTRIKTVAAVLLTLGALGAGTAWVGQAARAGKPPARPAAELVPGGGPSLRLPAAMLTDLGVRTAEVKARAARPRLLQYPGVLALDSERIAKVHGRIGGEVVEVASTGTGADKHPLRVGDRVKKGQLLAVVWGKDLGEKKAQMLDALLQLRLDEEILERAEKAAGAVPEVFLLNARRTVQAGRNAVARAERTLRTWRLPEEAIKEVEEEAKRVTARKGVHDRDKERDWARLPIRAPLDGIVVEKNVALGEIIVDPTTVLFQIADLSRLAVHVSVAEADLPALLALKPGQRRWTVRPLSPPGAKALPGFIDSIGYLIDPNQHTTTVVGHVDNPGEKLLPGQAVRVTVVLPTTVTDVAVPTAALVEEGGKAFVFVQPDAGKLVYTPRRVAVVRRGRDVAHVRTDPTPDEERQGFQPLRPGTRVVTAGAVELKALLEDLKARAPR
jgi:cobalt-zinc-cadmium efflux system membrane fusion protein